MFHSIKEQRHLSSKKEIFKGAVLPIFLANLEEAKVIFVTHKIIQERSKCFLGRKTNTAMRSLQWIKRNSD